ncbi:hypothetical protein FB478_10387 [Arthrobacter sp. AG367]|nr:hypothetical protein FB478_10387 [Arthrobacter sp. AG367]
MAAVPTATAPVVPVPQQVQADLVRVGRVPQRVPVAPVLQQAQADPVRALPVPAVPVLLPA